MIPPMIPIDEKLKLLQPVLGAAKTRKLRLTYFIEDDPRSKRALENQIDLLIARFVKPDISDDILLPPPAPGQSAGDIEIGRAVYQDKVLHPVHLNLSSINRHVGIFGSTGSGKTTFAKHLIRKLNHHKIPVLIFDWEQSYRDLIHDIKDLQIFTVGHEVNPLMLNLLSLPPGISHEEYIKSLISLISEDYIGGIGADTMLLTYMEMAFEENSHPAFEDLKEIVIREINNDIKKRGRLTGRSGLWKESVSRQMTFMAKGGAGTIINPRTHYPLQNLFDKPVILEFGHLKSPYDRKFFIHLILNWLTIYNHHCGQTADHLKQVIIFEEFHNIAMKRKEDNLVSTLFRESRKYGIGLIAIDQTPSQIPNDIFANMNVKVSFSLNTATDIAAMGKAMNLRLDQSQYLGRLNTGDAITDIKQLAGDSFQIRAPFENPGEIIPDETLREKMARFSENLTLNSPEPNNSAISQTPQGPDTSPLTPLEKVVLTHIAAYPFDGVDQRTKTLGLHPAQMTDIQTTLIQKGLIQMVPIDRKKLFELTDKGQTTAINENITLPKSDGHTSLEHAYWVHQTCQFLRKLAFHPVCEKDHMDIVTKDGRLAIEIETGKSDVLKNLLKLKNSQVSRRIMLATNKACEVRLKKLAAHDPLIQVYNTSEFFKLTKEELITNTP